MTKLTQGPPCLICGKPSRTRNMCSMHYSRWIRHGHAEQTRPEGWGKRSSHPLKDAWCWTAKGVGRIERWDDFWKFVEDVGERPDPKSSLKKRDKAEKSGPENCYWSEPLGVETGGSGRKSAEGREVYNAYQREWRKRNLDKAKGYDLKRHYGIGLDDYDRMLEEQNGNCAICGEKDGTFGRLVVDHCHGSKKVRGLLCSLCNRAIGGLRDNIELILNAAAYVERHK